VEYGLGKGSAQVQFGGQSGILTEHIYQACARWSVIYHELVGAERAQAALAMGYVPLPRGDCGRAANRCTQQGGARVGVEGWCRYTYAAGQGRDAEDAHRFVQIAGYKKNRLETKYL